MSSTIQQIPLPPVIQHRAILQASTHPRGGRPYVYPGQIDEWHAPGVLVSKIGATHAAVDAAWLVEKVLGGASSRPVRWPGVAGAREKAIEFSRLTDPPLSEYQTEGAAFLAERDYAGLFDQMGLGKTAQALIAAEARLALGIVPVPTTPVVLILCPALAKRHWQREVKKWVGAEAEVLDTLTPTEIPRTRYVIANYDILYGKTKRDASGVVHDINHLPGWAGLIAATGFLLVIADEAHMLRGRSSKRTQTAKKMCRRVPVVWALTGTPMPNYVRDLWALIDFISDGIAGMSYWSWAKKYCGAALGQYGWKDTGADNTQELAARLGFFCLGRSTASVGLQLPEKRREIFKIDVTMTAPTVHEGHLALTKSGFVAKALRATARAKRGAIVEQTLEALNAKQKVIVYTYMREQADEIAKAVRTKIDCPIFLVHGELSPDGRDQQATVFRDSSSPAAFVATIDSVGIAISLVGADLVIFADLVPEPWKLLQAEKRAHRRGSEKRVLVRYVIGTGTIDEGVVETVIEKLATIESALGAESDQQEMQTMLGGNVKSDESIIDGLFARLTAGVKA
jgi:SNF2 family DNA or RNA helicase